MSFFKKAERREAKLKIALTGPSGSGKTYSALRLAKGICNEIKKDHNRDATIAVVDTENGSAALYSGDFDFVTVQMNPPYMTTKYIKSIKAAIEEGVDVLILDSISHAWSGSGGILQRKEALDSAGKGNSFTNWAKFTPEFENFVAEILHSPIHIISTMRSKTEYVITDGSGKSIPRKVGLAPVQRQGIEYEFTTVFDIGINHQAEVSKDRTNLFDGVVSVISEETGKMFMDWLKTSKPEPASAPAPEKKAPKPKPQTAKKPKQPNPPPSDMTAPPSEQAFEPGFDFNEAPR